MALNHFIKLTILNRKQLASTDKAFLIYFFPLKNKNNPSIRRHSQERLYR